MESIEFWMLLSEMNELTLILSKQCPEYSERVTANKKKLSKYIKEGLEREKKLIKLETYDERNN